MRPYFLILIWTLLLLSGCSRKPAVIKRAFYYWKSAEGYASDRERLALTEFKAYKLYLKLFEVVRIPQQGAIPVAKTRWSSPPYVPDSLRKRCELVPTVFVHNDALSGLSGDGIDSLADNINFLTNKYLDRDRSRTWRIEELQIDCDWSDKNRDTYFQLLRKLKQKWGRKISCTLRLYPFKYRDRMGVPPVDRVMLMCYNLLNPLKNPERNTIVEYGELESYLGRKSAYPLPFDIALPVYSRMQLFQNGRFVKTLHAPDSAMLPVLRKTRALWYEVTTDTVFDNTYLRRGDAIKYEQASPQELANITTLLREKLAPTDTTTISLFHLDDNNLNRYPHEALEAAFSAFGS